MKIRSTDEVVVLELTGELDIVTTAPVLDLLTSALTETDARTVIFDLRDVTFMDSSAIKCLVYAQNRVRVRDGNVIVTNARPHVAKIIRILGLDREIEVHEITDAPLDAAARMVLPAS